MDDAIDLMAGQVTPVNANVRANAQANKGRIRNVITNRAYDGRKSNEVDKKANQLGNYIEKERETEEEIFMT